ncbi:glutathione S-transferase L3-like [Camellia sinensis]|uniref:glutathione S-transferase L3-like n=1 Tax=Camellia sinensis TaxID=4442 RepID=UPI00103601F4|nr:glutathione S-transferase L3-like [Camellia sinensis]
MPLILLFFSLHKFDDGPFFLGQFSMVDMAYVPFIERFQLFIQDVWKYDIMAGRPKLEAWFEEMNKVDAYKQSKYDPKENMKLWKKYFLGQE